MNKDCFTQVSAEKWSESIKRCAAANVLMGVDWERLVTSALPYVSFRHFIYKDTHAVRVAKIGDRHTTAPFADGGDVIALGDTALDLPQFQTAVEAQFGASVRLRVNERFTQVVNTNAEQEVAYEYVVDLSEPLLPRVRKTLRHVLSVELPGRIWRSDSPRDIKAAYNLYVRHMRRVNNFALPPSLFEALITDGGGELWLWSCTESPEAMAIFLSYNNQILYSLSAAKETAFSVHAPHHLVYQALITYQSTGALAASLGATGKGSSLEVFKRGWRGKQFAIYELGERSLGVGRKSRLRQLVGYVPLTLYPLLTTKIGKYFL